MSLYGFYFQQLDARLQQRYFTLVKEHSHAVNAAVNSISALPGVATSFAAARAMSRFLNHKSLPFHALIEPAQDAVRTELARRPATHVLVVHDWMMCSFNTHISKKDRVKRSHQADLGYELGSALIVDAEDGATLGPMELRLRTKKGMLSTRLDKAECPPGHVDEVLDVMDESRGWRLDRTMVHVIDREGDSIGHFRSWTDHGHRFLVRADGVRTVLWQGKEQSLKKVIDGISPTFQPVLDDSKQPRMLTIQAGTGRIEVAHTHVILHRPAKTTLPGEKTAGGNKKKIEVPGVPLKLRFVVTRVVTENGETLAEWWLFSNVPEEEVEASQLGQWYAWRWRIETFHKLLKTSGMNAEEWQQETGEAYLRRLCVAVMACVTVWHLKREPSENAKRARNILIRLSGRQMKKGVEFTTPALLAGLEKLLAIDDLMQDEDLSEILALARQVLPHLFRSG